VVDVTLLGEGAVYETREERVVDRRDRRRGEPVRDEHVGERVRLFDAEEDRVRDRARVRAGYALPRHVPRATGCPARKSDAASRRRPSSWTSRSVRTPSPVATRIPSGPLPTTTPGAAPAVAPPT